MREDVAYITHFLIDLDLSQLLLEYKSCGPFY